MILSSINKTMGATFYGLVVALMVASNVARANSHLRPSAGVGGGEARNHRQLMGSASSSSSSSSRKGKGYMMKRMMMMMTGKGKGMMTTTTKPSSCTTRANDTPDKIVECFEISELRAHHRVWQDYADAGDGTRYHDSIAADQTAFYIGNILTDYGYNVTYQPVPYQQYQEDPMKPAILYSPTLDKTYENAKLPELGDEFATYRYSGSGKVTATVQAVDYVDPATLGDGEESTSGCEMEDFADFVEGHVALIQYGTCTVEEKAENAQAAGASAVIIFNEGTPGNQELRMVARMDLEPYIVHIPVLGTTHDVGVELLEAGDNVQVYIEVNAVTFPGKSFNVLAETYGGDPDNVLILGAHTDSELLGAGIQDDGSGCAALLEVAKLFANVKHPTNKIRFGFWAVEEISIIGSTYYVNSLSAKEIASTIAYINADMIASPNHVIYIETLDSEGGVGPLDIVTEYYDKYNVPWLPSSGGTCFTDMCEFNAVGIQYADVYTGSSEIKTEEQVEIYGGVAGEPHDPCYHLACDNYDNVNEEVLLINARALGYITVKYAFYDHPPRTASGRRRHLQRSKEESKAVKDAVIQRYGRFKDRTIR